MGAFFCLNATFVGNIIWPDPCTIVCRAVLVYSQGMRTYLLLALIFLCSPASAGIYKWVDADGKPHYSDQAQTGSEEVKLPTTVTYTPTAPANNIHKKGSENPPVYTEVSIVQPKMNETLHSNTGDVQVGITIVPGLQRGDTFTIYLDGKEVIKDTTQTSVNLTNVDRGSHTLKVTVFDINRVSIISSKSIIFHLRKTSEETNTDGTPKDNSEAFNPNFAQDPNKKADYQKDHSKDFNQDLSKDYDSSNTYKEEGKKFDKGVPANSGTFNPGSNTYTPNFNQKK